MRVREKKMCFLWVVFQISFSLYVQQTMSLFRDLAVLDILSWVQTASSHLTCGA